MHVWHSVSLVNFNNCGPLISATQSNSHNIHHASSLLLLNVIISFLVLSYFLVGLISDFRIFRRIFRTLHDGSGLIITHPTYFGNRTSATQDPGDISLQTVVLNDWFLRALFLIPLPIR